MINQQLQLLKNTKLSVNIKIINNITVMLMLRIIFVKLDACVLIHNHIGGY